jgi:hypothetical protein
MKTHIILLLWILSVSLPLGAQVSKGKSQSKKITFKREQSGSIRQLPDLIIKEEKFIDENKNNIIDANEDCKITFKVENIGTGVAQNVTVRASIKSNTHSGITFNENIELGDMAGETENQVTIPIQGKLNTEDGYVEFLIEVLESRGFDAFPLEFKIETRKFAEPKIILADAIFSTEDGGNIKLNYPINLKVLVQNIGEGAAKDVEIKFELPGGNCIFLGEKDHHKFDYFNSGETRELDYLFTATRRYTENLIPVAVNISESYNRYANDTIVYVGLQQNLTAKNQVVIKGIPTAATEIQMASLSSDVDKNIPVVFTSKPFRYALIIGNEDYSKYQRGLNSESNVAFARHDAAIFKKYAMKVLGIEEKNLFFLTDATAGEMEQKIDLISKLAAKSGSEAEIFFYYAGHGMPDELSKEPYIMPVDVAGTNLKSAIKLADIYRIFSETGTRRVTVFLDACFSGGGREAGLLAARGVKVKPKKEMITGNMVVFTASSGEQSSLPYKDQQHGMFTYFLLKKLQESKGNITYGNLADYIKSNVSIESLRINSKEQDPAVQVSINVNDSWENWTLN